jgi:hypothetical protein
VPNLIRSLAELDAYRTRLKLLRFRLETGEREGLAQEAAGYIEQLLEIDVEIPELRSAVRIVIADFQDFLRDLAATD